MSTAVAETRPETAPAGGVGRVSRVIGPVVDVEFPVDQMPDIYNALLVDTTIGGETRTMTMEVALHIGDNMVRAIALKPTDGMQRGAEVRDTGAAISVERLDSTVAPRNAPAAPGTPILATTFQSTLPNLQCATPDSSVVPISAKCTVADAAAGLVPIARSSVVEVTP